ncbi:MAG: DUF1302 family protein, partial [Sterolibacterium sp.]|nr:DUF1302 family protein [Sterolibacterium sp.]
MKFGKREQGAPGALRVAPVVVALLGLLGCIGSASAFNIESGNPDIVMSLDNIIRYNTAWRAKARDPGLANNIGVQDESDYLYDKNEMITNRLDWFGEFDFKYQNRIGFRVSAQAWYDTKYGSGSKAMPGSPVAAQNIKGTFNDETRRYYHGPSGEFVDEFAWINQKV